MGHGTVDREESLYHESARELARMVVELEATVEGLGQQNSELEGKVVDFSNKLEAAGRVIADQETEIQAHRKRYSAAIDLIQRKTEDVRRFSKKLLELRAEVIEATSSVQALKDVPEDQLADAIGRVANALDTAVLR